MQPNLNDKIAQAKAAGYSDTEIQGYLQGAGFQPPAPQGGGLRVSTPRMATAPTTTTTTPTQIRGRGGTLTSLISEGGALGGAALGAAAGSFVPVIGTAIGGVIGAGLGAFGGRLAENKVRDDRLGVTDALKEGAISAVLSGPLKLGKYATVGAKGLIAGKGAQQAFKTAAKEATKFTIRGALGGKVTQASKDLAIKQFRINPTQLTNFAKKHGEDVTEVISRYKINNADDIASKGINPLMSVFDDISDNIPAIPKSKFKATLQKDIDTLIKSPVLVNQQLGARLQEQADALLKTQGKTISGTAAKVLRQAFDDAVPYTTFGSPERNVTKKAADSIRKAIQNAADDAGLKGPRGESLKDIGREVSKLFTLDDIVARQENLGRGSLPIGIISGLGGLGGVVTGAGAAGVGGAALGGPVGAALGFLGTEFINSPTGRRLLAQAGTKTGEALTKSGTKLATNVPRQVLNAAIRGGRGANLESIGSMLFNQPTTLEDTLTQLQPSYTQAGQFTPEGAFISQQPNVDTGISATTTGSVGTSGTQSTTTKATTPNITENPFTPELLIMAIASDPKNAALYERIYKIYQDKYATAQPKTQKLTTTAIKQLSDYNKSLANLDEVENLVRTSSGAFGPARGLIRSAIPQDVTAKAIQQATLIAAQNIGRALEGGKLTDADIARYRSALPSITDTPDVAINKINRLRKLITQEAQTYGQLTAELGGAGTLEDAILAQTGGAQ